jgi:hypothetical protein
VNPRAVGAGFMALVVAASASLMTAPAASASSIGTWKADVYNGRLVAWESSQSSACTAAVVVMALNMGGAPAWAPSVSGQIVVDVLTWEHDHDLLPDRTGSDPYGARSALNHFGWHVGGPYVDRTWDSFDQAAHDVVAAIARTGKPAVLFSWNGGHAQLVTGYEARGADPRISDAFIVVAIRLTDPLVDQQLVDARVATAQWRSGAPAVAWTRYKQTDSTLPDANGRLRSADWLGRFVAVIPTVVVRSCVPAPRYGLGLCPL